MAETDDLALLRRFQRTREEAAFAELLRRHWPMVFGVCRRIFGGDAARADEAAQEVFTRLAGKAIWFPQGVVLAGWLHRAALHVALTMKRAALRQQQREDESARRLALDATQDDGEAWALVQPHLDEALDGLPRKLRDAVTLCYLEGRSRREAGALLGCDENTVSKRLGRALEKLRVTLTKRGVILTGPTLALALDRAAAEAATVTVPAVLAAFSTSAGTLATSGAAATMLALMAKKSTILTATVLAIGSAAFVAYREARPPSDPANIGTEIAESATLLPKPTPGPEPGVRKVITRADWIARFRSLHGLGKAELLQRLAEMGFPLRERTLELLLKSAGTPGEFAAGLTQHLMLFHPDRLIADAIKNGVEPKEVAGLWGNVSAAWRQKKLENWMPTIGLVELMRSHFEGDDELLASLANIRRPYGSPLNVDPLAQGAKLLAIPAAQRRENQVMELALDWPVERAGEMAAWGLANLEGKERRDFFERLAYPAYASGNPDLAARLMEDITDPALYALAAPMAAATLAQYDRPEEALAILAKLEGAARDQTAKLIGKHWALRDPDSAIAWVNGLEGAAFNGALSGMFEHLPAATMRSALDGFAKQSLDPAQDAAVLRGLSRTTSWTDTATAAEVIPGHYATRGFAPLAAPTAQMWKGTPAEQSRALQFDVAARTVWRLSQKQDAATALAWADGMQWAGADDKLIAQAYALPEAVELYRKHSVLGPIRTWIDQQLADPSRRQQLEMRIRQAQTQR